MAKKTSNHGAKESKERIPLQHVINGRTTFSDQEYLANVFLKVYASDRTMENAYYKAKICTSDGEPVAPFKVNHPLKRSIKTKDVDEVVLYRQGLIEVMNLIQKGEIGHFSKVTLFAQERSITYSKNQYSHSYSYSRGYSGPPPGVTPLNETHYFLNLMLGAPGKKVKLSKTTSKVKACKQCETMLLRFTYNWVVQSNDFDEKVCPYCKKPLEIIDRERKYVKVDLDYEAKDCSITGTNNQIGIVYFGVPIKTTVKVAALRNLFMNYQNLFPSGVIGPLDIKMNIARSRKGYIYLDAAESSLGFAQEIEWRPVTLFPEDLITL